MSQDVGQDLTLMFVDIPAAVSQAEGKSVPRSRGDVEHCLSLLEGIQKRHGGKFAREVGNTLVCCFDTPGEGVRAACEMQQAVSAEESEGVPVPGLRIALHAGQAIMRNGVCTGEVMTTAARLVTVAHPGQIITTDRVTGRLGSEAGVQIAEAPNASGMETRLRVRLFQVCWGQETSADGTLKTATTRRERERVLADAEEESPVSPPTESGDSGAGTGAQTVLPENTGAGSDTGLDATEMLDLSAIRAEGKAVSLERRRGDERETAEAQPAMAEIAAAGGSSPQTMTFCLIWRGQVISIRSEDDVIHLGREEENEVVLDGDTVSRLHAHIECRGATFMLVDYSTNGTFVYDGEGNQQRVRDGQVVLDGSGAISPGCPQDAPGSDPILFWTTGK